MFAKLGNDIGVDLQRLPETLRELILLSSPLTCPRVKKLGTSFYTLEAFSSERYLKQAEHDLEYGTSMGLLLFTLQSMQNKFQAYLQDSTMNPSFALLLGLRVKDISLRMLRLTFFPV